MAQPVPYVPTFDFTDWQISRPSDPLPADEIDLQFNQIATVTEHICDRLQMIQRDDGALANRSVGIDQLKPEVDLGFNVVEDWVTAKNYVARDGVYYTTGVYRCLVSHVSDTFATDLAAGKWQLVINLDFAGDATAAVNARIAAEAAAAAAGSTVIQGGLYAAQAETVSQVLALRWKYSTTTTMADPGSSVMRFNAAYASATEIAISAVCNNTGTPNVLPFLATWDDSSSVIKGYVILRSLDTPTKFAIYNITGALTNNTSWVRIPVSYVIGNGTFSDLEPFSVGFIRNGDGGSFSASAITSSSNTAFAVGQNGAANPGFVVDASAATSVNGISVKSAAAANRPSLNAIGPGVNVGIDVVAKGFEYARLVAASGFSQMVAGNSTLQLSGSGMALSNSYRDFNANDFVTVTAIGTTNIPASTEMVGMRLNFSATQTHQTGPITIQRDMMWQPSTHAANGVSVITSAMGMYLDGAPRAGANVTITNSSALHVAGVNVANGGAVTNAFAGIFNAPTGATNNYGVSVLGGVSLFAPSASGYASLNVAQGTTPSSPVAGDMWRESGGWKIRHGGVTYALGNVTDCLCGEIDTAQNRDYNICLVAPYALTITSFITQSASGTCTAVLKNTTGTVATNAVSTSLVNNTTITNAAVAAGEKIFITISSNSAAKAVAFVANFTRNG